MNTAFDDLIGQQSVKNRLNLYLQAHKATKFVPFLNFVGAFGLGKTEFARRFAKNIIGSNGLPKKFIEINSASVKSNKHFFEQIFVPHVENQECVLFFDEAHSLPDDFISCLLTVTNTEKNYQKVYNNGDTDYCFDFTMHHFLFATTESQKLFAPLRSRLTMIEFVDYSQDELRTIFQKNLPDITFESDALDFLSETSRGNARSCVLRTKEVEMYCAAYNIKHFTMQDAKNLSQVLGILPQGLNRIEWQILNILREQGQCTLSTLSAKTGLSRASLQREHELYLMRKGFIVIDGLRNITSAGRKTLDKHLHMV